MVAVTPADPIGEADRDRSRVRLLLDGGLYGDSARSSRETKRSSTWRRGPAKAPSSSASIWRPAGSA